METSLVLLTLMFCLSGVSSDTGLTQPSDPVVVKPGGSHTLSCTASDFSMSSYYMNWVRQVPGRGLQWLFNIYGSNTNYADAIKGRFTISTDYTNNKLYLRMDNPNADDTAVYYCTRDNYGDKWGPGVMVTVTSETQKSPSVFPLTPCKSVTSEQITIGCLATGYVPGPVKIQFSSGSITNASKEMTVQYRNIFASNSFLAIPRSSLQKGSLNCTVEHEATKFKTSIEIKVKDQAEDEETSAALYLFCPHKREIEEVISNSQVNLVCMIKSSSKGDINVLWKENGNTKDPGMITEYTAKDPEKRHVKISMLTIRKEKWESDRTYSCRIQRGEEVVVEAWVRKNTCKHGN